MCSWWREEKYPIDCLQNVCSSLTQTTGDVAYGHHTGSPVPYVHHVLPTVTGFCLSLPATSPTTGQGCLKYGPCACPPMTPTTFTWTSCPLCPLAHFAVTKAWEVTVKGGLGLRLEGGTEVLELGACRTCDVAMLDSWTTWHAIMRPAGTPLENNIMMVTLVCSLYFLFKSDILIYPHIFHPS